MTRRVTSDGFTLIELLIALSLMGLVMGVVTTAFVVTLGTSSDTEQQLVESQAAGFASGILTQDVASASSLTPAGATCTGQSGSPVLTLGWTDVSTPVVVDYRFDSATGNLTRYEWQGGGCITLASATVYGASLTNAVASPATLGTRVGATLVLTGRLGTSQTITAYRRT